MIRKAAEATGLSVAQAQYMYEYCQAKIRGGTDTHMKE